MPKKPQTAPLSEATSAFHCEECCHLTPTECVILWVMQRVAHKTRVFCGSIESIATHVRCSPSHAHRALKSLAESGFIERLRRDYDGTVSYRPLSHEEWAAKNPGQCCQKLDRSTPLSAALSAPVVPVQKMDKAAPVPTATVAPVQTVTAAPTATTDKPSAPSLKSGKGKAQFVVKAIREMNLNPQFGTRQFNGLSEVLDTGGADERLLRLAVNNLTRDLDTYGASRLPDTLSVNLPIELERLIELEAERAQVEALAAAQSATMQEQGRTEMAEIERSDALENEIANEAFAEFDLMLDTSATPAPLQLLDSPFAQWPPGLSGFKNYPHPS